MAREELGVYITAYDDLTGTLNKVRRSLDTNAARMSKSFNRVGRSVTNLRNLVIGLGAAYGLKLFIGSIIDAGSETENLDVRLQHLLGSVEEGNRLFEELADFAGRVPFEFKDIMGAGTQLAGVMEGGVDQVTKWMPMIGDLAAVSGLSIRQTTEQVIRMYSAGAASADLFRERGITAMLGFQAGVSYSAEETREKLIEAWESPTSKFKDSTKDLAKTWTGLTSMMADAWFQFRDEVAKSGSMDFMKISLAGILEKVKELRDEGQLAEWAVMVSNAIIDSFSAAAEFLTNIPMAWNAVMNAIKKLAAGVIGALQGITVPLESGYEWIAKLFGMEDVDATLKSLKAMNEKLEETAVNLLIGANANEKAGMEWADWQLKAQNSINGVITKVKELQKVRKEAQEATAAPELFGPFQPTQGPQRPKALSKTELAAQEKAAKKLAELEEPDILKMLPEDAFSESKALYDARLEALQEYNTQKLLLMHQDGSSTLAINQEYEKQQMDAAKKKRDFQISAAADAAGGMSNIMQNLMTATSSQNEAMFNGMKAFAIAEAIINTYQGATKAYAQGGIYGFVGAASIIAAGMAQVAKISATKPGSTSGTAVSAGGDIAPPYTGGSAENIPVDLSGDQRPASQTEVNITIQNPLSGSIAEDVGEEIVKVINKVGLDNVKLNAEVIEVV
ncbi:MAG: hypothetical protein KAR06_00735 [Deltaproteobacteria bacterium]|nr:hypothetical protein [Deltaproteobacteria bacterium]